VKVRENRKAIRVGNLKILVKMKSDLKKRKNKNEKSIHEFGFTSLNGNVLNKIKGGADIRGGNTDRVCGSGCGAVANYKN